MNLRAKEAHELLTQAVMRNQPRNQMSCLNVSKIQDAKSEMLKFHQRLREVS